MKITGQDSSAETQPFGTQLERKPFSLSLWTVCCAFTGFGFFFFFFGCFKSVYPVSLKTVDFRAGRNFRRESNAVIFKLCSMEPIPSHFKQRRGFMPVVQSLRVSKSAPRCAEKL